MSDLNLVGKCGLYCGACVIYRAERDDQNWRSRIASNCGCTTEQVKCNGCGALGSECWGSGCKIVLCTKAKGYHFCYECDEYQNNVCDKFNKLFINYAEDNVDLRDNLARIQKGEVESWLEESRIRFSCKNCGNPIAAGYKQCHHCRCGIE